MASKCNVCGNEVGDAHVCVQCKLPVHLPCGKGIGEEGYGQSVLCKNCGEATEDAQTTSKETSNEFVLVNDDLDDVVKTQEIPENIWALIPPRGAYLIEIMKFCGYDEVDSVLLLREEDERTKMFDFIKEMVDIVDDKEKTFGIFATVPEKVRILPGVERKFEDFLDEVQKLKNPVRKVGKENRKRKNTDPETKKSNKKTEKQPRTETVESLTFQMDKWLLKKKMSKAFHISSSDDGNFVFNCDECGSEKKLPKDVSGKSSCSNAQKTLQGRNMPERIGK